VCIELDAFARIRIHTRGGASMRAELDGRKLANEITVNVRVNFDWRWSVGVWLMRFGAWLAGLNMEIEKEEEEA